MSRNIQVVGGYDLDLYCGNCNAERSFCGRHKTGALRQAKEAGWTVNIKKGTARCPRCKGKREKQ